MTFQIPPALRHRRYRMLWLGMLISLSGSQMQLWALFWHVRTLTDQPIAISAIGAIRFVPILIFSLIGGLVADRYNRRNILFVTQATAMLVALTLGLLTLTGRIQLWHLYFLTGIQAVAISFDMPARASLIPNLLPREDLPSAFSLQSIAMNTGSIIGPALSGLVIGYWGQEYTYLINAVSFLAVIAALIYMGRVPQLTKAFGNLASALTDIREGIRYILRQQIILSSMILDFFATFFSSANTLLPYVARDILHVNEVAYGWLASAQSIGAVTAGVILSQHTNIRRQGRLLLGSVTVFGLATILFGFGYRAGPQAIIAGISAGYILTFVALILVGAGDSVSTILRNTIRQLQTPDNMRGRMTSINQIFFQGGPQLGEVEAGIVAQVFSVPAAIVSGGIGCILGVIWISRKWPQLRNYNGDEPILAGATAE
ncbi:MAG: MFS transporter [Chloroflexi bacterium]|nr:MFS transporter [Chloroflexota bacterium]